MCGLSTVVTPAGASLTMYREIRPYANSIWDDNNKYNTIIETRTAACASLQPNPFELRSDFSLRNTNGFGAQIRLHQLYKTANGFRTRRNYYYIWPITLLLELKYIISTVVLYEYS